MQICPKCGYERKLSDDIPDWQCPHCGVAYCKVQNLAQQPHHRRKSGTWKVTLGLLLLILFGFLSWLDYHWQTQQIKPQLVPVAIETKTTATAASLEKEPIQIMVEGKIPAFEHHGYSLTPLASFELEAKVLGTENYWLGREADLSPTDLALGWGSMATDELLEKVTITQGNRWFYWWVARDFTPELGREISTHASNMHIIPATPAVEKALNAVKTGQVVYIKGYLIQANTKDGWSWRSSLSREDTGAGACELVWAEDLQLR